MPVKPANTYTASQVAALAKLKTTPLKDVNKFQADRTKANVRDATVQTNLQNRAISTLNKGYAANPGAYMNAAKKLNVDLAKVNPAAYAAEQKKLVKPTAKPTKQSSLGPSYLQPKTTGTRANLFAKGGMATKAKKSGINGVAIRGKTKGTLVTMTKMSGSRRSK
jgi:hypothetical protein